MARRRPPAKGPRALGLLELAANGKAHLVAVTIMLDGRFYDAGAYKADPVPMALHSETVYEAVKSSVSQGLFIVGGAMHDKDGWIGGGKWRSTAEIEAEKARAKAEAEKRAQKAPPPEQQIGGPPKLKRSPDTQSSSAPPTHAPAAPPSAPAQKPASTDSAKTSGSSSSIKDPNRPAFPPAVSFEPTHHPPQQNSEAGPLVAPIQLVPPISDPA